MSRMSYYKTVTHPVTGETVTVTGSTQAVVANKLLVLQKRWEKDLSRAKSQNMSTHAQADISAFQQLLATALLHENKLNWDELYDKESFKKPPQWDEFAPHFSKLSGLVPGMKAKHQIAEEEAKKAFDQAQRAYEKDKELYLAEQVEHNKKVDRMKAAYESKTPAAVLKYIQRVLVLSKYPSSLSLAPQVQYEPQSKLMLVEVELPNTDRVPRVTEYAYSPSKDASVAKEMKQREFEEFYNSTLYQIALRTLHEVFSADYANAVVTVGFNGYVSGFDPQTGKAFRNCVLSLQVNRREFEELQLDHISPRDCFRHLKGVSAGNLVNLAPVKPILQMNTSDKRIIEASAVLDSVDDSQNLASMDWQQFEILVRDLFQREFGNDGAKVEVTQASRDEGVDAIAYDPDPIRGGKFVIQAKRYNNLVPVSAVRDLYGTVLNEGAVKGILVTTSYYGPEARDFAKDKPLTLINGEQLMYLFNKHGYQVSIRLQNKRAAASYKVF